MARRDSACGRRQALVALLAGAAGLVLRCGGSGNPGAGGEDLAAAAARYDTELDCTSTSGMWPAEIKTRTDNRYRDRSERTDRYCFNCSNYVPPAAAGTCGTCRTVKGPIHPLGLCEAWTVKR